jgi:hypothetical protein
MNAGRLLRHLFSSDCDCCQVLLLLEALTAALLFSPHSTVLAYQRTFAVQQHYESALNANHYSTDSGCVARAAVKLAHSHAVAALAEVVCSVVVELYAKLVLGNEDMEGIVVSRCPQCGQCAPMLQHVYTRWSGCNLRCHLVYSTPSPNRAFARLLLALLLRSIDSRALLQHQSMC